MIHVQTNSNFFEHKYLHPPLPRAEFGALRTARQHDKYERSFRKAFKVAYRTK